MANENTPNDPNQPQSSPSPEPDPWATTPRHRFAFPPEGEPPSPYARPAENPWQAPQASPAPEPQPPSQPEPTSPYPVPEVNPYVQQYPTTPPPPADPPTWGGGGAWTPPPAASAPQQPVPGAPRPDANPIAALFDFSFTKFATPGLVKIVYILQVIAAVGTWVFWLLAALAGNEFGGAAMTLVVLLFGWIPVLLSIAFTRFVLEGVVALIRIHDRVTEMAARDKDATS